MDFVHVWPICAIDRSRCAAGGPIALEIWFMVRVRFRVRVGVRKRLKRSAIGRSRKSLKHA